jgi:hypothetical protein
MIITDNLLNDITSLLTADFQESKIYKNIKEDTRQKLKELGHKVEEQKSKIDLDFSELRLIIDAYKVHSKDLVKSLKNTQALFADAINDLEKRIYKMKNCSNCIYKPEETIYAMTGEVPKNCIKCEHYSEWELNPESRWSK